MLLTLQMSLLRVKNGYPVSVGDIVATVEDEPQVGNILMVRFFEGPGSGMDRWDWTVLVFQARQRLSGCGMACQFLYCIYQS